MNVQGGVEKTSGTSIDLNHLLVRLDVPASQPIAGLYRKLKKSVEILSNLGSYDPVNVIALKSVLIRLRQNRVLAIKTAQIFQSELDGLLDDFAWYRFGTTIELIRLDGLHWRRHVAREDVYVSFVLSKSTNQSIFNREFDRVISVIERSNHSDCMVWLVRLAGRLLDRCASTDQRQATLLIAVHRYHEVHYLVRDARILEESPDIPLDACMDQISLFMPIPSADVVIQVSHANLLQTSISAVMMYDPEEWFACEIMDVIYEEDMGSGVGVAFDWLCSVADELFHHSQYFEPLAEAPSIVHPKHFWNENLSSTVYEFAGRILGLALKMNVPIGVHLSSACIHMMTRRPVTLETFKQLDPVAHSSLTQLMNMSEVEFQSIGLDQGFVSYRDSVELFPGGRTLPVTYASRGAYIDLNMKCIQYGTFQACRALRKGLLDVLHNNNNMEAIDHALSRMTPADLNAMIGGRGLGCDLAVEPWKESTSVLYVGYGGASALGDIKEAFFNMVRDMTDQQRLHLLRFWTGLRCLPSDGFDGFEGRLRLVVHYNTPVSRLPTSQTCMVTINMPAYEDAETMRRRFELAIMDATMDND